MVSSGRLTFEMLGTNVHIIRCASKKNAKNLFSKINNDEKRIRLMSAIDKTNIKYGRDALSIAQARLKKKWNVKRQYSSKIDTACFDFLPTVKTI